MGDFTVEELGFIMNVDWFYERIKLRLNEEQKKKVEEMVIQELKSEQVQKLITNTMNKYSKQENWLPKWLSRNIFTILLSPKIEYQLLQLRTKPKDKSDLEFDDLIHYFRYISIFKIQNLMNNELFK